MQHISASSLRDLPTRVQYLRDFINFSPSDAAALHSSRGVVAPLVPAVVDAVYEKLFSFDITAKSFVPRQTGYTGIAPGSVEELTQDHPQIKIRKDFLAGYLVKLVSMNYETRQSWEYLDKVGLMHTGKAGFSHRWNKPALRVEYIHCAVLLGYVEDILLNAVMTHPDLDDDTKNAVARAVNKIVWIQNDLFARHYIADQESASSDAFTISKPLAIFSVVGIVGLGALLQYLSSRT
ncbi:hypothetical protein K443DRAFT_96548 [Laccaria amethystina LaAM-08-1]|uniref:Unplaced genomic scaffold K443scaffold_55, whole genome shotgun sequence n=1 Tax=Laccaria amethystina LaAM-08-1 TaxID=1095629 RepID=A0A0C9XM21_9AGAR|nr:hypothetical protein K443DRAFT_96548 [Laccaria amethystina LaAM-08-1]